MLDAVDILLTERSYKPLEIPKPLVESASPEVTVEAGQLITTMSGVQLARLAVEASDLRITPTQQVKFDTSAAPFKSFLIEKVLEPIRREDEDAVRKHELAPEKGMSYAVDQEGGVLKEIRIRNYGGARRLNEIKDKVRWTLRRMYEKTIGT